MGRSVSSAASSIRLLVWIGSPSQSPWASVGPVSRRCDFAGFGSGSGVQSPAPGPVGADSRQAFNNESRIKKPTLMRQAACPGRPGRSFTARSRTPTDRLVNAAGAMGLLRVIENAHWRGPCRPPTVDLLLRGSIRRGTAHPSRARCRGNPGGQSLAPGAARTILPGGTARRPASCRRPARQMAAGRCRAFSCPRPARRALRNRGENTGPAAAAPPRTDHKKQPRT